MSSEWKRASWGDVATLEYGKALRDYQNATGDFPVYGTNGSIGYHVKALCETSGVIIGRKGAYRGVHYSPKPFFVIDTAFYLKPKVPIDMRWAYYALLTCDINGMDSGSAIPSTSREEFYKLPAVIPPLNEQVQIADLLALFDDRISLLRETNATLETIAQALFKSWFVDFDPARAKMEGRAPEGMDEATAVLFPDSFEESELGLLPRGWAYSSIGQSFVLTMGQSPPGDTYNEIGEGLPFYQGRTDFGFRFPAQRVFCTSPSRLAELGDTLVSVRAPVGDVNMALERCSLGRGVAGVRHPEGFNSFVFYTLRMLKPKFELYDSEGTVFGSINKKDFQALPVIKPSNDVLQAFDAMASALDNRIISNEEQIRSLASLRDTLLPRLISGQLRLPKA